MQIYPSTSLAPVKTLENFTLEMSAKPFFQKDDAFISDLFRGIFREWWPVLKHAKQVSFLWFLGDGTDILTYDRDGGREVQWAKWQGFANASLHHTSWCKERDPEQLSVISKCRLYRPDPISLTYADIRRIVHLAKEAAAEVLDGALLKVGNVIDPGSEFTKASFRYERHPELLMKTSQNHLHHIDVLAHFHAENRAYAAFPEGIPEGLSFGTFLGGQCKAYMDDLGFDFIWFSNGLGFGRSPYAFGGRGAFFDGEKFLPEGNEEIRDGVVQFWKDFRAKCPDYGVEVRGTDFPLGVNLVNHATPYAQLYADNAFHMTPPPNTPWPALTSNYGIALAGMLSQNAPFPGARFPYRFYATDPWFCVDPYFNHFQRSPHDIYMTMGLSKLDGNLRICSTNDVRILAIDSAWGTLPAEIPNEVIPPVKRCLSFAPTSAAPILWVYPFAEYNRYTFEEKSRICEPWGGDAFLQQALNEAFPIGSVITTDNLVSALSRKADALLSSILLTPCPDAGSDWEKVIFAHLSAGGRVLAYGPAKHASEAFRARLGLSLAEPLSGDAALELPFGEVDSFRDGSTEPLRFSHNPASSQGGMCESFTPGENRRLLAQAVFSDNTTRAAAVCSAIPGAGTLVWVRASSSISKEGLEGRGLSVFSREASFRSERLMRIALASFGWHISEERPSLNDSATNFVMSRSRNAFIFAGYSADDCSILRVRAPYGAPVRLGGSTEIDAENRARISLARAFHEEIRIFVTQPEKGLVKMRSIPVSDVRYRRRWHLTGLKNATVTFFPEDNSEGHCGVLLNAEPELRETGEPLRIEKVCGGDGPRWIMRGVTGSLTFGWADDDCTFAVLPE